MFGSKECSAALQNLITQSRTHLFENEYNRVTKRAIDANVILSSALASAPVLNTPFPTKNSLGDQLKLVARMISSATTLGAKRQVFLFLWVVLIRMTVWWRIIPV
jgi:hypothetical protein